MTTSSTPTPPPPASPWRSGGRCGGRSLGKGRRSRTGDGGEPAGCCACPWGCHCRIGAVAGAVPVRCGRGRKRGRRRGKRKGGRGRGRGAEAEAGKRTGTGRSSGRARRSDRGRNSERERIRERGRDSCSGAGFGQTNKSPNDTYMAARPRDVPQATARRRNKEASHSRHVPLPAFPPPLTPDQSGRRQTRPGRNKRRSGHHGVAFRCMPHQRGCFSRGSLPADTRRASGPAEPTRPPDGCGRAAPATYVHIWLLHRVLPNDRGRLASRGFPCRARGRVRGTVEARRTLSTAAARRSGRWPPPPLSPGNRSRSERRRLRRRGLPPRGDGRQAAQSRRRPADRQRAPCEAEGRGEACWGGGLL